MMKRKQLFFIQIIRVLLLLFSSVVNDQVSYAEDVGSGCVQTNCVNGECAQGNFVSCTTNIICNNTGYTGTLGTCQSSFFYDNIDGITCVNGACRNSDFKDSYNITCNGGNSCEKSNYNRTIINCFGNSCDNSIFTTSAVSCDGYDACDSAKYYICSCCDGYECPNNYPSCTDPNTFCATNFLGRTCKDWGNPICANVDVPASSVTDIAICDKGDCANTVFNGSNVYCDNKNNAAVVATCSRNTFEQTTVDCDSGACTNSNFFNSTVRCYDSIDPNSCDDSKFNQSTVTCSNDACDNTDFTTSAVVCNSYSTCDSSWFFDCTCCDGGECPSSVSSCTDDPVTFCSSIWLGRTCKDWGNPACTDVDVTATSLPGGVTICDKGACANTVMDNVAVLCDNKYNSATTPTCQSTSFTNSLVACDSGACQKSDFFNSTVSCYDSRSEDSCDESSFNQSTVTCSQDTCDTSDFYSSAVKCNAYYSCDSAWFFDCSCCDGGDCPDSLPSCTDDPVTFCSGKWLGRTCKDWGNPACEDITITDASEGDVTICDKGACANTEITDAAVLCDNKYNAATTQTCQSTKFTNSLVACDSGACQSASFLNTTVTCFDSRGENSCDGSTFNQSTVKCTQDTCDTSDFYASAVTCNNYYSCDSSRFFTCSCCDGGDCPDNYPSCTDDPVTFCSNLYLGRTCKEWGNPICQDISVTETNANVLYCSKGDCANQEFSDVSIFCDNLNNAAAVATCESITFRDYEIACNAGACQTSMFEDAIVHCFDTRSSDSCDGSTFRRSTVDCWDDSCDNAIFEASRLSCNGYYSCDSTTVDECTCCDGGSCPSSIPSCTADPVGFCSRTMDGKTCTELGNPICNEFGDTSPVTAAPAIPAPTSSTSEPPSPVPVSPPTSSPIEVTIAPISSPVQDETLVPIATLAPSLSPIEIPGEDTLVPVATLGPSPSPTQAPTLKPTDVPPTSFPSILTGSPTSPLFTSDPTNNPVMTSQPTSTLSPSQLPVALTPTTSEVRTEPNQPVKIPPPPSSSEVDSVRVTAWPRNGGLKMETDGSVTYTPNAGFVGNDDFAVEICDVEGECAIFTIRLQVLVSDSRESSSGSGSSSGLYALALLALIPIGIIAFLYRKKMFGGQKDDVPDSTLEVDNVNSSAAPSFAANEVASRTPSQGRQGVLDNKDQARTHIMERQQVYEPEVAVTARELAASNVSRGTDPPSNEDLRNSGGYLPENKDQCRSVVSDNHPNAGGRPNPPMVQAVLVDHVYEETSK